MNNESLFTQKTVPAPVPPFQYSTACELCDSRDHGNKECTSLSIHLKKMDAPDREKAEGYLDKMVRARGKHS